MMFISLEVTCQPIEILDIGKEDTTLSVTVPSGGVTCTLTKSSFLDTLTFHKGQVGFLDVNGGRRSL